MKYKIKKEVYAVAITLHILIVSLILILSFVFAGKINYLTIIIIAVVVINLFNYLSSFHVVIKEGQIFVSKGVLGYAKAKNSAYVYMGGSNKTFYSIDLSNVKEIEILSPEKKKSLPLVWNEKRIAEFYWKNHSEAVRIIFKKPLTIYKKGFAPKKPDKIEYVCFSIKNASDFVKKVKSSIKVK